MIFPLRAHPLLPLGVAVALTLTGTSCQKNTPAPEVTKAEFDTVKEELSEVSARLKKLEDLISAAMGEGGGPTDPSATYAVPVNPDDPVIGPADAKVTIVEAYEFACPYCFKVVPTIDQVLTEYGKDVRVVSKYFVVHPEQATIPGLAACGANKMGKYAEMKAAIWKDGFEAQDLSPEKMEAIAKNIGLDVDAFRTHAQSDACQNWLRQAQADVAKFGTQGTPSFYVNGRHINGALPIEAFRQVIDEELNKANQAIAGGVSAIDYYRVAVVEGGKQSL